MKVGKPKSKRVPVRLRHRIEKASAAKQKKQRRQAKKNPEWRTRLKKDPGIPNLFPYKDKILAEIEEKRRLKEEETLRRRDEARALRKEKSSGIDGAEESMDEDEDGEDDDDDDDMVEADVDAGESDANPMAALLASARARAAEFDQGPGGQEDEDDEDGEDSWDGFDGDNQTTSKQAQTDSSRRAFTSTFNQLLSSADVLLYVLDARDPLGTRSKAVERQIMAADGGSKRLILILNKIDLVPPQTLRSWMLHLKRYFPTLPLRASNPAPNAKTFDHSSLTIKGTTESLVKALKSYGANQGLKRAISVGIIGYPNVGKSSVINALRARLGGRNDACAVGAEAGVTTNLQEVKLDGKIKLIDSPGIVFPSAEDENPVFLGGNKKSAKKLAEQARLILLNAVPPKDIEDPVPAVELLLKRLSDLSSVVSPDSAVSDPYSSMLSFYGIPTLMTTINADGTRDNVTDFLVQVARKRGRLGKGGVPNLNAAAFTVITDWRDGRIQGWTEAPKVTFDREGGGDVDMGAGQEGKVGATEGAARDQKKIVSHWAAEFKIEGLWGDGQGGDEDGDEMATG